MKPTDLEVYLNEKSKVLGFSHSGAAPLSRPLSFDVYLNWLQEGHHGEMKYLATHAPIKEHPQQKWPKARSALIFAAPYVPHPHPPQDFPLRETRLSLYARGYDYHHWFKSKLQGLCEELKELFPEEEFIAMTDSSPVLERDLAYRAGLGWIGKNSCIIHPKHGSLFFLGEIYSSLSLTLSKAPVHDFCGTCRRCVEACPTQALSSDKTLDARKCISYLTIESRQLPPEELREKMGDWLFGCDLCQTVCPWNQKVFKNQLSFAPLESKTPAQENSLEDELRWILTSSGKQLEKALFGTALSRAGGFGLKRNALIVAANRRCQNLRPEIEALRSHPKLGELAEWALKKLTEKP